MKYVLYDKDIKLAERNSGLDNRFWLANKSAALSFALERRAGKKNAVTAVFCGGGDKGRIGFLAAVWLKKSGADIYVYTVDCKADKDHTAYAANIGLPVLPSGEYAGGATLIVDAMRDAGEQAPDGEQAAFIEKLNGERGFKVAVDIPSGLDPDSGEAKTVFKADVTVAFSAFRYGHLFGVGPDCCGKIDVENIGLKIDSGLTVVEDRDFKPVQRKKTAHKGSVGRIYVIGGCGTMIGAPLIAASAAHAAFLNGAGSVVVCVPSVLRAAALARASLAVMRFMRDTAEGFAVFDKDFLDGVIKDAKSVVIGMGMGKTPDLKRIVEYLCANFSGALILDADALNSLGGDMSAIATAKATVIITPHVGEFKRLTGKDANAVNAAELASANNCIVALKSARTIITDGVRTRINITGTPAMAKGGTGDALAGSIAALTCTFDPFTAVCVACYRNGLGAERAVKSFAELMLTPAQMLKYADYSEIFDGD